MFPSLLGKNYPHYKYTSLTRILYAPIWVGDFYSVAVNKVVVVVVVVVVKRRIAKKDPQEEFELEFYILI